MKIALIVLVPALIYYTERMIKATKPNAVVKFTIRWQYPNWFFVAFGWHVPQFVWMLITSYFALQFGGLVNGYTRFQCEERQFRTELENALSLCRKVKREREERRQRLEQGCPLGLGCETMTGKNVESCENYKVCRQHQGLRAYHQNRPR